MRTRNSSDLAQVLAEAQDIAKNVGHPVSSTHVLLALFTTPNRAEVVLRDKRVDEDAILGVMAQMEHDPPGTVDALVERAHTLAGRSGARDVDCLYLLISILRARDVAAHRLLAQAGLDVVGTRNQAMSYLTGHMPRRLRAAMPPPRSLKSAAEEAVRERGRLAARGTTTGPEARGRVPGLEGRGRMPPPEARQHPVGPGTGQPELPLDRGGDGDAPKAPPPTRRRDASPPKRPAASGGGGSGDPGTRPPAPGRYDLDPSEFPWLSGLGRNLTQISFEGAIDPVIGREREVEEVIDILGKRRTNNPILVGEPGVGKTAIVEGLATELLKLGERAGPLFEKVVIELDMASILSGTHLRGSFSEKLGGIKDEVRKAGGRVIVFIDEIHTLVGAGATGDGPQDAANELKAALARGEFPCVGATTHDEYRKFIESDAALERRFVPVLVREPSEPDAVKILEGLVDRYADHHGVGYDREALEASVALSARYVTDRCLPDKAIGILDLAGSRARRQGTSRIGATEVARVVSKIAKVPEERLLMTDRERFLKMEGALADRIVGHRDILARVSQVVRRNYAGFNSHRPMGSFLFLGPTGVGKTELAKALADFLFGSADALVRCDMSEFSEPNTVARLIGAPPGYVGYGEGGQLTEPVRRRPFSVVLLDEIEKAHRDVLQLLLQLLDEGHLTDGRGRQVGFSGTLVILTSNLGSESFDRQVGGRMGFNATADTAAEDRDRGDRALGVARGAMAPELWNRIDERLVFLPLSRDEVGAIAGRLLADSSKRLAAEKQITYGVAPEVVDFLIEAGGYDAAMGARPMRRTIQRLVEAPLAERILAGDFATGDDVSVTVDGEALRFERARRGRGARGA